MVGGLHRGAGSLGLEFGEQVRNGCIVRQVTPDQVPGYAGRLSEDDLSGAGPEFGLYASAAAEEHPRKGGHPIFPVFVSHSY